MAKKFSCFSLAKRLFVSEAKSKAKKSRRWRWVFGTVKLKQHHAIAAPRRSLTDAREEQRKHALAVAIATAAAAEAAVAAADAAAQVVRLVGGHGPCCHEYERRTQNSAAIKIQTAYRAHLARQALKALKGLVRLQAVIRGQIVRRQLITKTKCLPSSSKTEPQVRHKRVSTVGEGCIDGPKKQFLSRKREPEAKEMKLRDYNLSSKEDLKASRQWKREATIKLKKHSFSYREMGNDQRLEEPLLNEETGLMQSHGHWLDVKTNRRREKEKTVKSSGHSNSTASDDAPMTQHKLRHFSKHYSMEELNLPFSLPRRSFSHPKHSSIWDETSLPNSPVFPTYMAATESAKARTRSTSTPKQRLGFPDTLSDSSSPCKLRLSSWTCSFDGEVMGSSLRSVTTKQKPNSPRGHLW